MFRIGRIFPKPGTDGSSPPPGSRGSRHRPRLGSLRFLAFCRTSRGRGVDEGLQAAGTAGVDFVLEPAVGSV